MPGYPIEVWKAAVEILTLWLGYYILLVFLKGTRAKQVLVGIIFIVVIFFAAQRLGLYTLDWILTKLLAISAVAFVVIFQPELRRGLASIGEKSVLNLLPAEAKLIEELTDTAIILSKKRIGALIAIERETGLDPYLESGVVLDSCVSNELLQTIFMYNTPLHDGGVVIRGNRAAVAGCLFPLTHNPRISKSLGTRHRAAIGLTEETDAVVIVVSEETGGISIAIGGRLTRQLDEDGLERVLKNLYAPKQPRQNIWRQIARGGLLRYGPFAAKRNRQDRF